ncbi:hypothetical protein ScPMuIL_007562 [Solemya velum]
MKLIAEPTDCSVFYMCLGERSFKYQCPPHSSWDQKGKACVPEGSPTDQCTTDKAEVEVQNLQCSRYSKSPLPDSYNCAKFHSCVEGENGDVLPERELKECPYPLLYDSDRKQCNLPETVKCGQRYIPKDPCEYSHNQCSRSANCIPCSVRFPSCRNLADGLNTWRSKEWSPHFVVCREGRVVYQGMCSQTGHHIFHPKKRICIDFSEVDDINRSLNNYK